MSAASWKPKKIAAIAEAQYVTVWFHNPSGPGATAAPVRVDTCMTNFIMQEYFCEYDVPWRFDLLEAAERRVGGRYAIPRPAGLGVGDLVLATVRAHSFDPAVFPADVDKRLGGPLLRIDLL